MHLHPGSYASTPPDEGIWIPLLIEKYNIKLMQEKGFKLSAEDIYSVNKACMKDAVVNFNGGCTGELISGEGLLITNHHCGYGQIQEHSSLENDYLTNGFWAMSRDGRTPKSRRYSYTSQMDGRCHRKGPSGCN